MHENIQTEKALLVVVAFGRKRWPIEVIAEEFRHLVLSCGIEVSELLIVNRKEISSSIYIGKGKVEELAQIVEEKNINVVIFNNDLSPAQQRNLEDELKVKTIDRTQLIVEIFVRHAHTQEALLQVELAQLRYLLPRLKGKGIELSRLGGGIGTRGPGEKKLEIDRRRITDRITKLTQDLTLIRQQRQTMRKKREKEDVAICSLVGYTSAGKSTLFNALTNSNEKTSNDLFTTLHTVSHTLDIRTLKVVLTDTVGFIYELPPHLVEAFKATLEELQFADVLLHIIDAHSSDIERLHWSVKSILDELNLSEKPTVLVFNKVDLISEADLVFLKKEFSEAVFISALNKTGLDALQDKIYSMLFKDRQEVVIKIPFNRMEVVNYIHNNSEILKTQYTGEEAVYWVKIKNDKLAYLEKLKLDIKKV